MNSADGAPPHKGVIQVAVVSGWDDLMKAMAVRAAVYLGEAGRAYGHEFDGNDHHATHLLATIDGEPVGCCRIRYFGTFAKPERLTVLPSYRRGRYGRRGVAYELAQFAFDFCHHKGYRTVYGHAVEELVGFWARFGTEPMPDGEFEVEGYKLVAMAGNAELPADALGLHSGHLVLIRPEGAWDRPGPLEGVMPASTVELAA